MITPVPARLGKTPLLTPWQGGRSGRRADLVDGAPTREAAMAQGVLTLLMTPSK